jgi:hypothetical protein
MDDKVTVTADDVGEMPSRIVEAVGTTSPLGRGSRGKLIELAMAQAGLDIQKKCEEIWASDLPVEEKNAKIAEISNTEALKAAKLAYRDRAKVVYAEMEAAEAAKAAAAAEAAKQAKE